MRSGSSGSPCPAAAPQAADRTGGSAVAVACGAQLLNAVNIGACPLMLPAITGSLGGQAETLSWLVASYAIVFGGLVLWGGKSGDSHGIGRVLPLGFLVSVVGSLVAVVAPDATVLVAARVLQGVGAALAVPNGMAWLTSSTDDPRVRSRRLSWFAGSGAIGFAVGALAGGVLSDRLSWRAVFGAECLVALVLGVLALRSAPRRTTRTRRPVPWGAFATSTALALAVLALYAGPRSGWLHPSTLAVAGVALVAAAVAAWRERVGPDLMIPLHVWRIPGLWGVLASTAFLYAAWAGCYYYGAIALAEAADLSMTGAALWLAPLACGALTGAALAARVLPRARSRRTPIVVGGLLTAAGALGASILPLGPLVAAAYLVVLLVAVTGQVLAFVSQSDLVVTLLGPAHAGIAGGLFTAAGQVGGGLGLAVLAIVAAGTAPERHAPGHFPEVFWAAALVAAVSALLVVGRARTRATGEPAAVGPSTDTTEGR